MSRFDLSLRSVAGSVDEGGRVFFSLPPLPRHLLPMWRDLLRDPESGSNPVPRAYLLGGRWFLEANAASTFALELARARGEERLTVTASVRSFGTVAPRSGNGRRGAFRVSAESGGLKAG